MSVFNSFHQKLQFTSEIESENKINFLDLTIIRNENNEELKTKWYTKDTWSGRYLNYNSHHATSQKNSVIIGLADRALALTSPEFRPRTLKKVRNILKQNNFPTKQINKIIKQRIFKFYNNNLVTKKIETNNPTKNTLLCLIHKKYLKKLNTFLKNMILSFVIKLKICCHPCLLP